MNFSSCRNYWGGGGGGGNDMFAPPPIFSLERRLPPPPPPPDRRLWSVVWNGKFLRYGKPIHSYYGFPLRMKPVLLVLIHTTTKKSSFMAIIITNANTCYVHALILRIQTFCFGHNSKPSLSTLSLFSCCLNLSCCLKHWDFTNFQVLIYDCVVRT